jgi:hypothetical protein
VESGIVWGLDVVVVVVVHREIVDELAVYTRSHVQPHLRCPLAGRAWRLRLRGGAGGGGTTNLVSSSGRFEV